MRYISLFLLLLLSIGSHSQQENQSADSFFLKEVFNDWRSRGDYRNVTCDTLYYTENIEPSIVDSTISIIRKQGVYEIYNLYHGNNKEPLVLAASEQEFLIKELGKLKQFRWRKGLLPKSKVIPQEDIEKALAETGKLKTENERNMCSIIYTFSKPIYFRNNTICLFFGQKRYRGNYTQLEYDFYIELNKRWVKYAKVYIHYESEN